MPKIYKETAEKADQFLTMATSSDVSPGSAGRAMAFVRQFLKECMEHLPSERNDPNSSLNRTIGGDIIIKTDGLDGPSFRCYCGCNVFRKTACGKYKCNSCSELYSGEPKDEQVDSEDQEG
jgi:hypothetical protein